MKFLNVWGNDKRKVNLALELLKRAAPAEHQRFLAVVSYVVGRAPACGCGERTISCTYGTNDQLIAVGFHKPIADLTVPDLALVLSHEARHWKDDLGTGQYRLVDHACNTPECLTFWERQLDPIYSFDSRLEPVLQRYWSAHRQEIEAVVAPAFPWKEVGVAAAIFIGLWGLGGK